MDENAAAAPGHAGAGIVVDLDDKIVEVIIAAKVVAWFSGRAPEWPVVASVGGVLAPGVEAADAADREPGSGSRQAVSAPPQPQWTETAARCRAVALALVGADAGAAERDRHG